MYELTVQHRLNAAHALRLADGSVEPTHGHDWQVRVTVGSETLDPLDMVVDFHDLEQHLRATLDPLNHTSLNDHADLGRTNPSAERFAQWIAEQIVPTLPATVRLIAVAVTEAPGCVATYRPPDA